MLLLRRDFILQAASRGTLVYAAFKPVTLLTKISATNIFPNELPVGSQGGRGEHKKEGQEKDRVQSNISILLSKKRQFYHGQQLKLAEKWSGKVSPQTP